MTTRNDPNAKTLYTSEQITDAIHEALIHLTIGGDNIPVLFAPDVLEDAEALAGTIARQLAITSHQQIKVCHGPIENEKGAVIGVTFTITRRAA